MHLIESERYIAVLKPSVPQTTGPILVTFDVARPLLLLVEFFAISRCTSSLLASHAASLDSGAWSARVLF